MSIICEKTCHDLIVQRTQVPQILTPEQEGHLSVYTPPVEEFEVDRLFLKEGDSFEFNAASSGSIILIAQGCGEVFVQADGTETPLPLRKGQVFYQTESECISLRATSEMILFRAHVNGHFNGSSS